jgi:hypothetical protein
VVIRSDHAVVCSALAVIRPHHAVSYAASVQPALHMVRVMNRFFGEVVDCPAFSPFMQELRVGYMEILNEELSSYALDLALAIVELEVAYPEIQKTSS